MTLCALTGLAGCKQQLFLDPADMQQAVTAGLPRNLEINPHDVIKPPTVTMLGNKPADVLQPMRPPRPVTLRECIAVGLDQGNIGSQSSQQFGFKNEVANSFQGQSVTSVDAIRAFALDPASASASVERALSRFDARWVTQMVWQKVDQPVAAQFLSFQQQRDGASFSSRIDKPLPSGGLAGITFNVDYSKFASLPQNQQSGFVNPNYTPRLTFSFQQPLLRQYGVEINQINDFHPGRGDGSDFNFPVGASPFASNLPGQASILVTRIRADQSRSELERNVNFMLVNIETAYWNLYSAYYGLYAQEEGLRQSFDGYRFVKARVESGTDPQRSLEQARAQLELFRSQVIQARDQVLESERQLRGLIGLRSDDGVRLVPVDEPNLAPFQPDFYEAANEAMVYRPELMLVRQELKVSQLQLRLTRNNRQPDLRLIANYDVAGLGTRLDGSELIGNNGTTPGNAFSSLHNNQFNSWDVRLRMDVPIGWRDTSAQVRQAQLQMTRNYIQLRDAEMKTLEYLTQQYRRVISTHAAIAPLRARREALQRFLYLFRVLIETGAYRPEEYLNFLTSNRDLADAIRQEFAAIAQYNSALAQFEFAKGTVQRYNNLSLQEGPLPPGVLKRASDHERERSAAIKLRERPAFDTAPTSPAGENVGPVGGSPTLPLIGDMPPPPELDPGMPKKDLPVVPKKDVPAPAPKAVGVELPSTIGTIMPPMPAPAPGMPPETVFPATGETVTMPRFQPSPRITGGPVEGSKPSTPILPPFESVPSGIPATLPK
jgi:outer membrane protein TolC